MIQVPLKKLIQHKILTTLKSKQEFTPLFCNEIKKILETSGNLNKTLNKH